MGNVGPRLPAMIVKLLTQRLPYVLPMGMTALLFGVSLLPRVQENHRLASSFRVACAILALWQILLWARIGLTGRRLELKFVPTKTHWVQALVQIALYVYWACYWREVYDFALLIGAQLIFVYAVDMLLCWSRRSQWVLGFGQITIVLSTNFFLWFRDDWFYWQFVMLAVGAFGKEFIKWNRDGRRRHIFNPSGLSLTVVSLCLIATGTSDLTWGEEIATTIGAPWRMYLAIFLVGLVVQYNFSVTLMTLSATVALVVCSWSYTKVTGVYYFLDANIPVAVFLGLHLLVTDPATSPRTSTGRLIFGGLYGLLAFGLFGLLAYTGVPTFYDKLLCVPLLNLSARGIDRIALSRRVGKWIPQALGLGLGPAAENRMHIAVWIGIFCTLLATGFLGPKHEGMTVAFWQVACENGRRNGCKNLVFLLNSRCESGEGASCNELGTMLMDGQSVDRDPDAATANFARACALGHDSGCQNLTIQLLFHQPRQERNELLAEALSRQREMCEEGDGLSCYLLGYATAQGVHVGADLQEASRLYRQSCDLGYAIGCTELGRLYMQEGSMGLAVAAFEMSCDGDHALGCSALGFIYLNGTGVQADREKAKNLLEKACALGAPRACAWLEREPRSPDRKPDP